MVRAGFYYKHQVLNRGSNLNRERNRREESRRIFK